MKRGTPDHPKTHMLAAVLNVQRYAAVGILESLWHFAQQYAQAGDVGRYQDEAIARAIGWEGNAATLVSALAQSGWLDRCNCHRARIHDWPTHADQTVKRWLGERNQRFLVCYDDASTMLAPNYPAVAVAVAVAVPLQSQAEPGRAVVCSPKKTWSAEAIDDHRELKGEPVAGKVLSALKPLVDRYGWEEVRERWRRFLASPEGKYGPLNFAENYLALERPPARASPPTVGDRIVDVASKWIEKGSNDREKRIRGGSGKAGGSLPPNVG